MDTTDAVTAQSGSYSAGASAQLIGANPNRRGLMITVDPGASAPVYLVLGTSAASTTSFDVPLAPGGSFDGRISDVLWQGAVQFYSAAAGHVGVVEV
jgi:hypothetical protein